MITKSLSEQLHELAESAAKLPSEVQDSLAKQLAIALDNARWDAQLRDPANLGPLRELIEEAQKGPKLPWPSATEAGVADHLDPEDLTILGEPDGK